MPGQTFRVASFNAENLFTRARVLNMDDNTIADGILKTIGELDKELRRTTYDKPRILSFYRQVKDYITISEDIGKLWRKSGYAIVGVAANGKNDWSGSIQFKPAKFSETERKNTARVLKETKADIVCLVEVENKPSLRSFDAQLLSSRYKYEMLIDAMDPRGIDVGLYSKFPLGGVWTHMYDMAGTQRIFSRDCLEVEIMLPDGTPLYMLCNHFKSKGYGSMPVSNAKRKRQAERVAEILREYYDLQQDLVIVAGDFNDTADSTPLQPLISMSGLKDVLALQYPQEPEKRWTYHFTSNQQIDFMLVSRPLQDALVEAGAERRGIYGVEQHSVDGEQSFDTVTRKSNQASDHAAVWAKFQL
jgi:endonuclease/exonuclease/phosphatase family metal-dependent hydrolase